MQVGRGLSASRGGTAAVLADARTWTPEAGQVFHDAGLTIRSCRHINDVFEVSDQESVSLVVVAVQEALEAVRSVRSVRTLRDTPLLAIVSETADLVAALDLGADDVIPFATDHDLLAARLRALLRREARTDRRNGVISVRDLRIDLDKYKVTIDGQVVNLTATEFRLLACLALRAGRVVDSSTLLRKATGYYSDERDAQNVIKVHIANIRRKLGDESYIFSVRGFGYVLERRQIARPNDQLQSLIEA